VTVKFALQNCRDYPVTGHVINFELKPAVPLTTLLLLDAATQGVCKFEGRQLRGEFFDPDVRWVSSRRIEAWMMISA
jgi:hypothetical protein